MKQLIQKTKKAMRYRITNWLIGLLSFVGILGIIIFDMTGNISLNDNTIKAIIVFLGLSFFVSFFYEYFVSQRTFNTLSDLAKTVTDIEQELSVSLSNQNDSLYVMTISNLLSQTLSNLKEKNLWLESEIERNRRLSENINEFYNQMKTLRETDFKFDFFEYEVKQEVFVFITGLVTFMESDSDITEITADDLFQRFRFSIRKDEFKRHIQRCIDEDVPMNFECSVSSGDNPPHWLKFWGRACADKTRVTGAITEITKEVMQRNIEKERAIHDNITGFYNRNALPEIGGKALSENKPGEVAVFLYIGLIGYQDFQDRYGMVAGNSYIRAFAEVLKKFVYDKIIPFRWWGSDFMLLIKNVSDLEMFKREFRGILGKIEKYMNEVDGIAVTFPVTAGYAVSGLHGDTPAELIEYAAFAQHEALRGKNEKLNPFNRDRYDEVKRSALRRTFIKDIIDRNQLSVVFQPIVSLKTGELFGFEALSRPLNPIYRNIVDLIDDAEASGHYAILEKRMVYNALDAYMLRHEKFKDHYLFINTAPYATLDERDYNDIRDRYFGHMRVVFEVVERNQIDPREITLRKSIVTKAGAKFALDDFGSGYSNHLALLALEPDIIKLDKELIRGIDSDLNKQYMIEDIINYSKYRGTKVLAEGIETRDELETLCRMGADYAQGYYLGMPMPYVVDADEKAKEVIRSIRGHSRHNFRSIFLLSTQFLSARDEALVRHTQVTSSLVYRLAKKLDIKGERLKAMITAVMMHDYGLLYPDCRPCNGDDGHEHWAHSIFAYLILKEYSPYIEYNRAVLYHHCQGTGSPEGMDIPNEADLIALCDDVSQIILAQPEPGSMLRDIRRLIEQGGHRPDYIAALNVLVAEGFFDSSDPEDYATQLLEGLNGFELDKPEAERMIRMLVYSGMYGNHRTYGRARVMEMMINVLSTLMRHSWTLIEKTRVAGYIYSLSKTSFQFPGKDCCSDSVLSIRKPVDVCELAEKAGLTAIADILRACDGENSINAADGTLMGKDVIMGARMIILSNRYASLMEDGEHRSGISCIDAIESLKKDLAFDQGYMPILEIMEEYAEDIDWRLAQTRKEADDHYESLLRSYHSLKRKFTGAD